MNRFLLAGLVALMAVGAGCGSAENGDANAANTQVAVNTAPATPEPPAVPPMTPTETLKALSEASNARDTEKLRSLVSAGTLDLLEEIAKKEGRSVDELLREPDGAPFRELPRLGKEEVEGDRATVEIQNSDTKQFEKLPFVKENGVWKIAIDEYLRELDARMQNDEP